MQTPVKKCPICEKNKPTVWWGGLHICTDRKCRDEAWRRYQAKSQRRNPEGYGCL